MALPFSLRPAGKFDFDFCWPIYRDAVQPLMVAPLEWNEADRRHALQLLLTDPGSSVVRSDGSDAGWLNVKETGQVIELRQFFLLPAARNHGLGTGFLGWMKERADRKRKDLTTELVAGSRARHLFERLGFKAAGSSGPTVTLRY